MVSKTAQADIEDLWEQGLKPTFADIIRLNAVALKVEHSANGMSLSDLPRVAFLGGVAFREPTIGSEIWLNKVQRLFDGDDSETFIILRAFSLSMPQDKLPEPTDVQAIQEAVQQFKNTLAFATLPQVLSAVGYAIHGFKHDACENATPPKKDNEENEDDGKELCYEIGLLRQGMLHRIGNAKDLCDLPPHVLQDMVIAALSRDSVTNMRKDATSKLEDDYLRTLDEITARLKEESKHG